MSAPTASYIICMFELASILWLYVWKVKGVKVFAFLERDKAMKSIPVGTKKHQIKL